MMKKQHDKQFKEDAIKYYLDHKELAIRGCAKNIGIRCSTLSKWLNESKSESGIQFRGSGNYASDEQKEIAQLKRELRDTKDAFDVLKKDISILGNLQKQFILKLKTKMKMNTSIIIIIIIIINARFLSAGCFVY